MMRWRPGLALALLAALVLPPLLGCGVAYKLPNEVAKGRTVPSDKSYQMLATWKGMDGITDILLTQGVGSQLFMLFNHGGTGTTSRGEIRAYPLTRPTPLTGINFPTLFNPIAMCSGGGRVFVLDGGDSCIARANPANGSCDSTGGWDTRITDLGHYWRVREYGLLGGDTLSTFTDTTFAQVRGVAADAQGHVYVSGLAVILVPDAEDPRFKTRTFLFRVYRYAKGPRYPGVKPADPNMPGANWHRDTTFVIEDGGGLGFLNDPQGLFWSAAGQGNGVYAVELGKNLVQKIADEGSSVGLFLTDAGGSGTVLNAPLDVAVDLAGFIYIADTGNRRVVRCDSYGTYVQTINVETDADGQVLQLPVTVAADDSLAYVGDRQAGKVLRYKRRT